MRYEGKSYINDKEEKRKFAIAIYSQTHLQNAQPLHASNNKKGVRPPHDLFDLATGEDLPSPRLSRKISHLRVRAFSQTDAVALLASAGNVQLDAAPLASVDNAQLANQLGWNCFDIALGLREKFNIEVKDQDGCAKLVRKYWVDYALSKANEEGYRKLLAPEIQQAVALTSVYLNMLEEKDQKQPIVDRDKEIMKLFQFADTLLDNAEKQKVEEKALGMLKSESESVEERIAKLKFFILPENFWRTPEQKTRLQAKVNPYQAAHEKLRQELAKPVMQPAKEVCNRALHRAKDHVITLDEWHAFFTIKNQEIFADAYKLYRDNYKQLIVPQIQQLQDFCENIDTYKQYINDYYGQFGWVSFQPKLTNEQPTTSIVDIIAKQINTQIIIYQQTEGKLKKIYETEPTLGDHCIIEFKGNNHFVSMQSSPAYAREVCQEIRKLGIFRTENHSDKKQDKKQSVGNQYNIDDLLNEYVGISKLVP